MANYGVVTGSELIGQEANAETDLYTLTDLVSSAVPFGALTPLARFRTDTFLTPATLDRASLSLTQISTEGSKLLYSQSSASSGTESKGAYNEGFSWALSGKAGSARAADTLSVSEKSAASWAATATGRTETLTLTTTASAKDSRLTTSLFDDASLTLSDSSTLTRTLTPDSSPFGNQWRATYSNSTSLSYTDLTGKSATGQQQFLALSGKWTSVGTSITGIDAQNQAVIERQTSYTLGPIVLKDERDLTNIFRLSFSGTLRETLREARHEEADASSTAQTALTLASSLKGLVLETSAHRIETSALALSSAYLDGAQSAGGFDPAYTAMALLTARDPTAILEQSLDQMRSDLTEVLRAGDNKITLLRADTIDAGAGRDTIIGSASADTIEGGAGADLILAGAGDDFIALTAGDTDTIDGGLGLDTVQLTGFDFSRLGGQLTLSGTAARLTLSDWDTGRIVTLSAVETLVSDGTSWTPSALLAAAQSVDQIRPQDLFEGRETGLFSDNSIADFSALFAPEAASALDIAQSTTLAMNARFTARDWTSASAQSYATSALAHQLSFTAADSAKLLWSDSRALTASALGSTITHTASFTFTGPATGSALGYKADKLQATLSQSESWTDPTATGAQTWVDTRNTAYLGTDSKGSSALSDDANFSVAISETVKGSSALSGAVTTITEQITTTTSASFSDLPSKITLKFALTALSDRIMQNSGSGDPTALKSLDTDTLASLSFSDASGLSLTLSATVQDNLLTRSVSETLRGISYSTADFRSSTALLQRNTSYQPDASAHSLLDHLLLAALTDPAQGLGADHLRTTLQPALFAGDNAITLLRAGPIDAGAGHDTVIGSAQADTIRTGSGVNVVAAGAGDDMIVLAQDGASFGADRVDGGLGLDTLDLSAFGARDWGAGIAVTGSATSFALTLFGDADWGRGGAQSLDSNGFIATSGYGLISVSGVETVRIMDAQGDTTDLGAAAFLALIRADPVGSISADQLFAPEPSGPALAALTACFTAAPDPAQSASSLTTATLDLLGRAEARDWLGAPLYDPNSNAHTLRYTDALGAALSYSDARSLALTAQTSTLSASASLSYTGPTKVLNGAAPSARADALTAQSTQSQTTLARDAKGTETLKLTETQSLTLRDSRDTALLTDDLTLSLARSQTLTQTNTLSAVAGDSRSATQIWSLALSYSDAGAGVSLALKAAGSLQENWQDSATAQGVETQTKSLAQTSPSSFSYADTGAKLTLGFGASASVDALSGLASETLTAISLDTLSFKATNAKLTRALEAGDAGLIARLRAELAPLAEADGLTDGQFAGGLTGALTTLSAETLAALRADLLSGNDIVTLKALTTAQLVETGAGDDRITGSALADLVDGGAGSDLIFTGAGNDTILGSSGRDTIDGGLGTDLLDLDSFGYTLGAYDTDYKTNFRYTGLATTAPDYATRSGKAADFVLTDLETGATIWAKNIETVKIGGVEMSAQSFLAAALTAPEGNVSVDQLLFGGAQIAAPDMADTLAQAADGLFAPQLLSALDLGFIADDDWGASAYFDPSRAQNSLSYIASDGATLAFATQNSDEISLDYATPENVEHLSFAWSRTETGAEMGAPGTISETITLRYAQTTAQVLDYVVSRSQTTEATTTGFATRYDLSTQITYTHESGYLLVDMDQTGHGSGPTPQQMTEGSETVMLNNFHFVSAATAQDLAFELRFSGVLTTDWAAQSHQTAEINTFTITEAEAVSYSGAALLFSDQDGDTGPFAQLTTLYSAAGGGLDGAQTLLRAAVYDLFLAQETTVTITALQGTIDAGAGVDTLDLDASALDGPLAVSDRTASSFTLSAGAQSASVRNVEWVRYQGDLLSIEDFADAVAPPAQLGADAFFFLSLGDQEIAGGDGVDWLDLTDLGADQGAETLADFAQSLSEAQLSGELLTLAGAGWSAEISGVDWFTFADETLSQAAFLDLVTA